MAGQTKEGTVALSAGVLRGFFAALFIVIGFLSYAIAVNGPLGTLTAVAPDTPQAALGAVRGALFTAHNFAHDALFLISLVTGIFATIVLGRVYGRKGSIIGISFAVLSVLLLLIEPRLPVRTSLGALYGTIHTPLHISVGVLQVIVGAATFGVLRKPVA